MPARRRRPREPGCGGTRNATSCPVDTLSDIVRPAELAILEPFYRAALVEPGTLEYHSADTGLDFHFAAVPIPNLDGEVDQLLVTVTDVTQTKADEAALREAESRYRTRVRGGAGRHGPDRVERPLRSGQPGVCAT